MAHLARLSIGDILKDGDTWARHLYDLADRVKFFVDTHIARAVLDMNRAPHDRPPENPDGIVKTVTVNATQVWDDPGGLSPELADLLIARYHRPYHGRIEGAARKDAVLFGIDCHTMLSRSPGGAPRGGEPRPMICISNGGDGSGESMGETLTAPPELVRALCDAMQTAFRHEDVMVGVGSGSVLLNNPFRGGHICMRHGGTGFVPWVQFELNRALYLPETSELTESPGAESQKRLRDLREKFFRGIRGVL